MILGPQQRSYDDVRRKLLFQRAVLTVLVAGLVVVLPLGPNRFLLAAIIVVVQAVSTWPIERRRPGPIDELGAFMLVEHGLVAVAGVVCPPSYVAASMLAIASLGINAPYLTIEWLRRIAPVTIAATVIAPIFRDVSHAPTVICITGLLSLHMAFNRSGAVIIAERAVAKAQWQADHDPLTGLANRRVLIENLDQLDPGTDMGLILIDMNHFKMVNDTFGHDVGDVVLRSIADRLTECGESNLAIRLGGDEFAVMVPGSAADTEATADLVLRKLSTPVRLSDTEVRTDAAIGMVHSSTAARHEMLRFADIAMYQAKRSGTGRSWYSETDEQRESRRARFDPTTDSTTVPERT